MFKNISTHTKALLAVVIISITWGTTWLPSKLLVHDYKVPPMQISSFRMILAGLVFIITFYFKTKQVPTLKQLGKIIFLSLFFIVMANAFSLKALSYEKIGSGIGAVLGATVPLWVALMTIFFFQKQKLTSQIILGLVFGFGGIVVIFSDDLHVFTDAQFLMPLLYSTLASIAWSLGTLLNAKKDASLNPFYMLGWQMLVGGIILYVCSQIFEVQVPVSAITGQSWAAFAYLVIIGSFLSFASYIYALKNLPAAQVATYAYINPLVALLLGFLWRHEKNDNPWIIAGTLVTLAGVYLVNRGFEKQKFTEE